MGTPHRPRSMMTPQEQIDDVLRHFPTLLDRWRGANAQFWSYCVSHKICVIRLTRAGVRGNLQISCSADYLAGPTGWRNARIEIRYDDEVQSFVVEDKSAGVRIVGGAVEVKENVNPVEVGY